jgi:hypothetical protein
MAVGETGNTGSPGRDETCSLFPCTWFGILGRVGMLELAEVFFVGICTGPPQRGIANRRISDNGSGR